MSSSTAKRMWALEGPRFTLQADHLALGAPGVVTIPVPCFLVEHDRGLVLFDTGIVPEAADDPSGVWGAERVAYDGLDYRPSQRVDRQIEALGFSTDDIDHVVLSHAHDDHTGGLRFFSRARIYAGRGEMPHAYWPQPQQRKLFRLTDLEPAREFAWREVDEDLDLFDDGSIVILTLPGHTPGGLGLLVRLPSRSFLLPGDAVHLRYALQNRMPMGADWNTETAVRSIDKITMAAEAVGAEVWIGHDPEDWAEFTAGGREFA